MTLNLPVTINTSADEVIFHLRSGFPTEPQYDEMYLEDFNTFSSKEPLMAMSNNSSLSRKSTPIQLINGSTSQEENEYISQMEMELEYKTHELYSHIRKHSPSKDSDFHAEDDSNSWMEFEEVENFEDDHFPDAYFEQRSQQDHHDEYQHKKSEIYSKKEEDNEDDEGVFSLEQ